MNKGAQVLGESTRQVGKQLHELEKHCNHFCRLLEEDMVHEELIVFTGSTQEFLKLLEPLLRSNHCKVNGKNNREALLRVIDSVIKIQSEDARGYIKFVSLLDAAKRFLSEE